MFLLFQLAVLQELTLTQGLTLQVQILIKHFTFCNFTSYIALAVIYFYQHVGAKNTQDLKKSPSAVSFICFHKILMQKWRK